MISDTVLMQSSYVKRSSDASASTIYGFASCEAPRQKRSVLGQEELLAALRREKEAGRIRNKQVEQLLRLPSSRVAEIFEGTRQIKLNEAKRLVEAFDLEEGSAHPRLHTQAARLFVRHAAKALGADVPQAQVEALAADLQGFVEFVTIPEVSDRLDRAQEFFLGRLPEREPDESKTS